MKSCMLARSRQLKITGMYSRHQALPAVLWLKESGADVNLGALTSVIYQELLADLQVYNQGYDLRLPYLSSCWQRPERR